MENEGKNREEKMNENNESSKEELNNDNSEKNQKENKEINKKEASRKVKAKEVLNKESSFKVLLGILILLIIVAICYAEYKNKQTQEVIDDANNLESLNANVLNNLNNIDSNTIGKINRGPDDSSFYNPYSDYVSQDKDQIEKLKNQIQALGNTAIYQVVKEHDGREVLQIKPEVQYEIALAGIIKGDKPEEKELSKLKEEFPKDNGIWISKQSQEKFMKLLSDNGLKDTTINSNGYLIVGDDSSKMDLGKKLKDMVESKKLYVIDMQGKNYERDYISGEIVEYPFEEMDPTQTINPYELANRKVLEITSNSQNYFTPDEILMDIVSYK